MSLSEEEQVKAMLASMGVEAIDEEEPQLVDLKDEAQASTPPEAESSTSAESLSQDDLDSMFSAQPPSEPSSSKDSSSQQKPSAGIGPTAGVLPEIPNASKSSSDHTQGKEFTVSALLHLLGLPTKAQVQVLESKLDAATAKLSTMSSKVERLSQQSDAAKNESLLERIDFQLSEIRAVLKKSSSLMASTVTSSSTSSSRHSAAGESKDGDSGPMILTSAPSEASPKKSSTADDDANFQKTEGRRVRGESGLLEE